MEADLELIGKFHGHLGPYVVLGYRMGMVANRILGDVAFEKEAKVFTGTTPPISCLIDGIQLASGCTLGKGNIKVENAGEVKARFTNKKGKVVEISLVPGLQEKIEDAFKKESAEELCRWIWSAEEKALLSVRETP